MVTARAGTVSVVRPAAAELQGVAVAESTETQGPRTVSISLALPSNRTISEWSAPGFDAYDGETARVVVVFVNHMGYGLGETTIRNGSFEIVLPKTNEPYNMYGLYIDRGKDDACTRNVDPFWQMASGGVFQDVNWEVNPLTPAGLPGLDPCNINGLFDLTQPLPCPGKLTRP
jgi:hypothetical protein